MGLLYIGAVLERSGHEVQVLDLLVSRYSVTKWVKDSLIKYDINDGHLVWRWN